MSAPDPLHSPSGDEDPRRRRLESLAGHLGVEMPRLDGPLLAFEVDDRRGAGDPVYLAGDLHAVHPRAGQARRAAPRDNSLDSAIVTLADHVHEMSDLAVIEGLWGTRIEGERLPAAPYFSLTDSEGRMRAWLLLPPPRLMVGIAHLWFPSVPPHEKPDGTSFGPSGPSGRP